MYANGTGPRGSYFFGEERVASTMGNNKHGHDERFERVSHPPHPGLLRMLLDLLRESSIGSYCKRLNLLRLLFTISSTSVTR